LRRPFVDVRLSYQARGSGFGKRAIAERSVNYAATESLLSDEDHEKNPSLQMFPATVSSGTQPGVKDSSWKIQGEWSL